MIIFLSIILSYKTLAILNSTIFFCLHSHYYPFVYFSLTEFCGLIFAGGNFCAGYDLKQLSQDSDAIALEPNVTQGPAPMVREETYSNQQL